MSFTTDLTKEVETIFKTTWKTRDGQVVPEAEDVQLGNHAVELDGTVLYADLAESTSLVNTKEATFAAEVYKTYLLCASRIITKNGGSITAFDGDRVMGVFIGNMKNTSAAKAALQINYAVQKIINPKLKAQYSNSTYEVKQSVGVDTSKLFVARTGIRGSNDLVWVGRAANYAAKMCSLRMGNYASFISKDVYDVLHESVKFGGESKSSMWERYFWSDENIILYRSAWWWNPDM
jgi:class 3 adenylate cyclase